MVGDKMIGSKGKDEKMQRIANEHGKRKCIDIGKTNMHK